MPPVNPFRDLVREIDAAANADERRDIVLAYLDNTDPNDTDMIERRMSHAVFVLLDARDEDTLIGFLETNAPQFPNKSKLFRTLWARGFTIPNHICLQYINDPQTAAAVLASIRHGQADALLVERLIDVYEQLDNEARDRALWLLWFASFKSDLGPGFPVILEHWLRVEDDPECLSMLCLFAQDIADHAFLDTLLMCGRTYGFQPNLIKAIGRCGDETVIP
ncbi:MAG: hypothetical protein AAF125_17185, partial [Chloroflexota bacterium]